MKPCCGVLLSIVALCTVTATTSPQDVPAPSRDCTYYSSAYDKVWSKGQTCAESGATATSAKLFQTGGDLEVFRSFFVEYCQRKAIVRDCLARQQATFGTCHDEKLVNIFKIYLNGINTVLDVGCAEGGGKLATIFHGLFSIATSSNDDPVRTAATMCGYRTMLPFQAVLSSKIDLPSGVFILYLELPKLKECLSKVGLERAFQEAGETLMAEVIRTAKCVDPRHTGVGVALVPCDGVDASLLRSPTLCAVKATDATSMYDVLETEVGTCFAEDVDLSVSRDEVVSGEVEKLSDAFEHYCHRMTYSSTCKFRGVFFAEVCLDEQQRTEFRVATDSIVSALLSACSGEGKRLAEIMVEVYRLNETSGRHAVRDCVDVAMATRQQQQSGSSPVGAKNLRLYQEAVTFKGCLLEKLVGDQRSLRVATSMMEKLLGALTCLHPEDGTSVPCKTLVTSD